MYVYIHIYASNAHDDLFAFCFVCGFLVGCFFLKKQKRFVCIVNVVLGKMVFILL